MGHDEPFGKPVSLTGHGEAVSRIVQPEGPAHRACVDVLQFLIPGRGASVGAQSPVIGNDLPSEPPDAFLGPGKGVPTQDVEAEPGQVVLGRKLEVLCQVIVDAEFVGEKSKTSGGVDVGA